MNILKWRHLSRIILLLLISLHIITWYIFGIHAVGSIGIEALFSGLSRGVINAGFIFWILVFISALLFGRVFCGWFCWFGGFLELTEWSIGKIKIKIPRRALLYLGAIPFVSLILKIYSSLLLNWLKAFPAGFSFQLSDAEPWAGQQTGISIVITIILFGPILFLVFGRRAWCRYLCPIGALLKIFSSISIGRIRLVKNGCIGCGKCNNSCDMHIDVMEELKANGEVKSLSCIRCFKCTSSCPKGSIAFSMKRRNISLSSTAASRIDKFPLKQRKLSGFDIAISVLWIAVTLILLFTGINQGAPQEIKVIMSAGLLLAVYGLILAVKKILLKLRKI